MELRDAVLVHHVVFPAIPRKLGLIEETGITDGDRHERTEVDFHVVVGVEREDAV